MRHTAVVDLGYGDAGKGTVVDWLCATQPVHAVVRFSGGAQAAHNVVLPDGRHHTFAQFGSGTLHSTPDRPIVTYLSRFMLVEPFALATEAEHLTSLGVPDPLSLVRVDQSALLTTPFHAAANRAREAARGEDRHGSCGIGIGETMSWALDHPDDAPRVADIGIPADLRAKLTRLRAHVLTEHQATLETMGEVLPDVEEVAVVYEMFADAVRVVDGTHLGELLRTGPVVFEGSQGVLLDEWRGFHPHTTWSTTTFDNVTTLIDEADVDPSEQAAQVTRLGVVRTYTTRHGAGPMVTEDPALADLLPEPHNGTGRWQGGFRVGHFDAVAHRYALEVCGGVDALAVTHLDRAEQVPQLRVVDAYRTPDGGTLARLAPGPEHDLGYQERITRLLSDCEPQIRAPVEDWVAEVERVLGVPVQVTSHGPAWTDKAEVASADEVAA